MRLATLFASALVNVLAATAASGQTTISISPPVVTTSGQGEVKVTPDRASVMIGVQTRGATATAAGGTLGQLLEVSTGGPIVPPRPMFDLAVRSAAGGAVPTPVNPGQQTVTAFVSAKWRFVPR